ncbi:Imm10 family immunity protein [Actinomadura hibisca]|uniref:Imm10 family immunity protein n=1 Tax=Actinomadura hibisca TaxID=68565 RepID=UPI00082E4F2B|nr:Imm10 family immunity protein [Actinomadura hibisca]
MRSDEYYLLNAVKVRIDDGTAICAAANDELNALRRTHGQEPDLQPFLDAPPSSPAAALIWLTSAVRLKYLYAGLEIRADGRFFARADVLTSFPPDDPLEAFWAQAGERLDHDEPFSGSPAMRRVGVAQDDESFTVGLAEHADGTGAALLFSHGLAPAPARPGRKAAPSEPYSLSTHTGATYYGGVRTCVLREGTLHITLSRTASQRLGVSPELVLPVHVSEDDLDVLRNGLRQVLTSGPRRSRPHTLEL